MNPDTAEIASLQPSGATELIAPRDVVASHRRPRPRFWSRLRGDQQRMLALRDTWKALWLSRLLVWAAGVGALLTFGFGPVRHVFNPPGLTRGFGRLGDLLVAPAARWDAVWYLVIARHGYHPELGPFTSSRAAFFPLYPLTLRLISDLGTPPILAGVLLSLVALAAALYGIHRLTTLELGAHRTDAARLTVMLTAFAPMAFYFSAVYSEALYLALSVGVLWSARNGRWATAAVLGGLASATRSAGVVLLLPVLILYLYGPREDRVPDFPDARGLRLRYRPRRDLLWVALVPAGVGVYMAYLALAGGSALMPFHAQEVWSRHLAGPYLGVWDGAQAAFAGLRQLLSMQSHHLYFPQAPGDPFISAEHNVMLFVFLLAALPAIVGVLRLLPLAYGAYVLGALALPLSYPVTPQPLMSLPRFLVVLFPLNIWLAVWLANRPRSRTLLLGLSAVLMMFFVGQFASWHWVA
jgi:Mannosyltransferase (PIG-V)